MPDHFRHLTGRTAEEAPQLEKGSLDFKVIGAGYAKCATMSLFVALEILGYRSYHMIEVLKNPEAGKLWHEVIQAKHEHRFDNVNFDWSRLLGGYDAGVDAPIMDVYDELAEAFPDAKVILSVREPEAWFRSLDQVMLKPAIHNTTYYWAAWWDPALWNAINMVRYVIDTWAQKYGGGTLGPHMMQPRIDEVKATCAFPGSSYFPLCNPNLTIWTYSIPAERLLVFDVKEGWEPLCKFLGKPIPDQPFPRVNDGDSLKAVFTGIKRRGMLKWAGTFAAASGVLGFLGIKYLQYARTR